MGKFRGKIFFILKISFHFPLRTFYRFGILLLFTRFRSLPTLPRGGGCDGHFHYFIFREQNKKKRKASSELFFRAFILLPVSTVSVQFVAYLLLNGSKLFYPLHQPGCVLDSFLSKKKLKKLKERVEKLRHRKKELQKPSQPTTPSNPHPPYTSATVAIRNEFRKMINSKYATIWTGRPPVATSRELPRARPIDSVAELRDTLLRAAPSITLLSSPPSSWSGSRSESLSPDWPTLDSDSVTYRFRLFWKYTLARLGPPCLPPLFLLRKLQLLGSLYDLVMLGANPSRLSVPCEEGKRVFVWIKYWISAYQQKDNYNNSSNTMFNIRICKITWTEQTVCLKIHFGLLTFFLLIKVYLKSMGYLN